MPVCAGVQAGKGKCPRKTAGMHKGAAFVKFKMSCKEKEEEGREEKRIRRIHREMPPMVEVGRGREGRRKTTALPMSSHFSRLGRLVGKVFFLPACPAFFSFLSWPLLHCLLSSCAESF